MASWSTVRRFLKKRYGEPIGSGLSREVYGSVFVVFKFPKDEEGEIDNTIELESYSTDVEHYVPKARCRMISILGKPILMMEKVDTNYPEAVCWEWHDFVDCHQIGLTRQGKEVAYDYADC